MDNLVTKEGILSPKVCLFRPIDPRLHRTVTNSDCGHSSETHNYYGGTPCDAHKNICTNKLKLKFNQDKDVQ